VDSADAGLSWISDRSAVDDEEFVKAMALSSVKNETAGVVAAKWPSAGLSQHQSCVGVRTGAVFVWPQT
jgi:hypothetical protein